MTGATGFVGQTLMAQALSQGIAVQALTRRRQPDTAGVSWIEGSLENADSLATLMTGCTAAIHVAGIVNAADRAGFARGNIDGTDAVISAARVASVARVIHVSSLSAREPALSDYGWSKAEAETVVRRSGLDWTIVRPPAIYGPGDREMIDVYRMARRGIVLTPPSGRISLIEVGDLARLLLRLIDEPTTNGECYEVDDGHRGGWSHADYARMIGMAVDRRVLSFAMPRGCLRLGARLDRWLRGANAKLTPDRAAYFCHADWVARDAYRVPENIWQPAVDTPTGLQQTAATYRAAGWL